MYAVIRTGSKQYRVSPGDAITIEKIDVAEGKKCHFKDVVLFHDGENVVADPRELSKVRVDARVVSQGRSEKLTVFKYKPKKGYRKKKGHRQSLTRVEIEDIIVVRKTAPRKKAAAAGKAGGASGEAKE
ncbi:MAG: 50S ribosomal protein L21 [Actinobacteria bacterium]|nr:50S ribosomal protein L21 [Actinomycetota bacterium]